ncbi:MAG: hypothetical protein CM15mV64_050 [uncultured marine virus]|jgi:hypothetical protein|nr:MAG: hypothetical protein CM15mV64_050 [uncultured marine virus]|tara:strand:+ start:4858 stop:5079 length:222 start_codon:yes stop_codon:yes gene_type:complete
MARATVAEIDKRLSSHEAACEQRWKENYRRLEAIENAITSVNKTIRNTLIFVLTIFLGVTGFLLQEVIYQAIS